MIFSYLFTNLGSVELHSRTDCSVISVKPAVLYAIELQHLH